MDIVYNNSFSFYFTTEFDTQKPSSNTAVTTAFLGMFSPRHRESHIVDSPRQGNQTSESEDGGTTTGTDDISGSDADVPVLLESMAKPGMHGCIKLLEQLKLSDNMLESE